VKRGVVLAALLPVVVVFSPLSCCESVYKSACRVLRRVPVENRRGSACMHVQPVRLHRPVALSLWFEPAEEEWLASRAVKQDCCNVTHTSFIAIRPPASSCQLRRGRHSTTMSISTIPVINRSSGFH
jgi:hypothetical protein